MNKFKKGDRVKSSNEFDLHKGKTLGTVIKSHTGVLGTKYVEVLLDTEEDSGYYYPDEIEKVNGR